MTELTLDTLETIYRAPHPMVLKKTLSELEPHSMSFISRSPFCVISSAGPDGRQDVSPRGGEPGFIHAPDTRTLLMPDRGGNNRLDSLRNLLAGSGHIGMMFMIPGFDDVLRVNGRASVVDDPTLHADFIEFDKPPRSIVRIAVEEVFIHCPKALMRAALWDPSTYLDRSSLPSQTDMFTDQLGLPKSTTPEEQVIAGYRTQL